MQSLLMQFYVSQNLWIIIVNNEKYYCSKFDALIFPYVEENQEEILG